MKKCSLMLSLIILMSCSKDLSQLGAANDPLPFRKVNSLAQGISYEKTSESFNAFLWPEKIDWASPYHNSSMADWHKQEVIMFNMVSLNYQHDDVDEMLMPVIEPNTEANKKFCFDPDFPPWPEDEERCNELEEILNNLAPTEIAGREKFNYLNDKKSSLIDEMQSLVDADRTKPQNWLTWLVDGDKSTFYWDMEKNVVEINRFAHKVPYNSDLEVPFTLANGNIFDFEYNQGERQLRFKVKDINANLVPTGFVYYFKLNSSNFLERLRFTGDVQLLNEDGKMIRKGQAKIEFVPLETEVEDDTEI